MPVRIKGLSRREFLLRAALSASGLALLPSTIAATRKTEAHTYALLSDTHIAGDRSLVVRGMNMGENLGKAVSEVLELPKRPALVFHTGDCAYSNGRPEDYKHLTSLLDSIRQAGITTHIALGNHDERDEFQKAALSEPSSGGVVPGKLTALVRTPRANWFILDSLDKTNVTPGFLGPEQLAWLAQALDANKKRPAIVLVHHNPGVSGNMGLKDTVAFLETIRPRRQVKAYVFGHTHTWKIEQDRSGIHMINLPAVGYAFNKDEPLGWVHARLLSDGIRLELRCLDRQHRAHGQVSSLTWRES